MLLSAYRPLRHVFCCLLFLCAFLSPLCASAQDGADTAGLRALEQEHQARIGLVAVDVASGQKLVWRGDERFTFCSTFKAVLAACILDRSLKEPGLLSEKLHWPSEKEVDWSPVTGGRGSDGMTVAELCAASLGSSDNTAANLLLDRLGGPQAVTDYVRKLGDVTFRLDRMEPELNLSAPGDERDTTTALAYARTLQSLLTGQALPPVQRRQLLAWMAACTTGTGRIRAGLPADWRLAHKTGSSGGLAHDVGLAESPDGRRILLVILTHSPDGADMARKEALIASAARCALRALGVR